jgi:hypothetical protein
MRQASKLSELPRYQTQYARSERERVSLNRIDVDVDVDVDVASAALSPTGALRVPIGRAARTAHDLLPLLLAQLSLPLSFLPRCESPPADALLLHVVHHSHTALAHFHPILCPHLIHVL